MNTRAILYNWKTADQIEAEYSLNNKASRAKNKPGCHHPPNRFTDSQLQFMSDRPI